MQVKVGGEKRVLFVGEVEGTSYRAAITLCFERLKGVCHVEEDGKFIPENGNGACNKMKAGKRMQCILGSSFVSLEHETCWGGSTAGPKRHEWL